MKLIKTLNCFWHGLSYAKLIENDTTFATQKLADVETRIPIPAENQTSQETTFIYDNIDHLEETFSGSAASYRLNTITIPKVTIGPLLKVK